MDWSVTRRFFESVNFWNRPFDQAACQAKLDASMADANHMLEKIASAKRMSAVTGDNRIDIHVSENGQARQSPIVSVLVDAEKNKVSIILESSLTQRLVDRHDPRLHGPYMVDVPHSEVWIEASKLSMVCLDEQENAAFSKLLSTGWLPPVTPAAKPR